jgi:hypothetical protein
MSTKLLFGGLLVLTAMLLVMPASAELLTIKSTLSPSFSMSVAPGDIIFPLTVGNNEKLDANAVTVSSNIGFTIKAKDHNVGAPWVAGKMRWFDGTSTFGAVLTNPTSIGLNSGAYSELSGTDATIYTSAGGASFVHPVKLKVTTTISDAPVMSPGYYLQAFDITGAANP